MKTLFRIFVLSTFLMTWGCGGNSTPSGPSAKNTTPMGVGLSMNLADAPKTVIDSALTKLFSDVQSRDYTQKLKHSDYFITIKTDCIDRNGTKVWLERLDTYDGTEYDQDPTPGIGMIYQAERVELPGNPPKFTICLDNLTNMSNTTRFGAEHIILYYNDRNEYHRTAVNTHVHPIIL